MIFRKMTRPRIVQSASWFVGESSWLPSSSFLLYGVHRRCCSVVCFTLHYTSPTTKNANWIRLRTEHVRGAAKLSAQRSAPFTVLSLTSVFGPSAHALLTFSVYERHSRVKLIIFLARYSNCAESAVKSRPTSHQLISAVALDKKNRLQIKPVIS